MEEKKICVIGHFGFGEELLNGQTIKTKIITKELIKQLGKKEVLKIDTHGGKKDLLKLFFQTRKVMAICKNVVIMPANNGLKFFAPLLCFWNKIYKKRIHYIVIGGWLADFIKNKNFLIKCLQKFNGIYVETNIMKKALENMGFRNIYVMPNCKELHILNENELVYSFVEPLKLCTFSRVMKEKGIEDIVHAVEDINRKYGISKFSLDIYGQIDEGYRDIFEAMIKKFPKYIRYCGSVPFDKSTDVLKNYFALVFPTRFYTEGIPGTIIDAYASGVPVISSKWESFHDLIDDGKVGYGYQFGNYDDLVNTLIHIAENPECMIKMKTNCIEKANEYAADKVVGKFAGGGISKTLGSLRAPLKLCTFSRVLKEKGIEDAIEAVTYINEQNKREIFSLDIYGQIDDVYKEDFMMMQKNFPEYINYSGIIPFDCSAEALKNYYALIFPTYYEGEGFAGTLIDAMAAGVPVIASDWKYNTEIVKENTTGILFPAQDIKVLIDKLMRIYTENMWWNHMKQESLKEAVKYLPQNTIQIFMDNLE